MSQVQLRFPRGHISLSLHAARNSPAATNRNGQTYCNGPNFSEDRPAMTSIPIAMSAKPAKWWLSSEAGLSGSWSAAVPTAVDVSAEDTIVAGSEKSQTGNVATQQTTRNISGITFILLVFRICVSKLKISPKSGIGYVEQTTKQDHRRLSPHPSTKG